MLWGTLDLCAHGSMKNNKLSERKVGYLHPKRGLLSQPLCGAMDEVYTIVIDTKRL